MRTCRHQLQKARHKQICLAHLSKWLHMDFKGSCACGAIRYEVKGSPFVAVHCHCESCRKTTGSPMTSYFGVGRSQVTWQGSRCFYNSSPGVTRGFCGTCGTPVHYMTTRWPGETYLFAATLENQTLFQPWRTCTGKSGFLGSTLMIAFPNTKAIHRELFYRNNAIEALPPRSAVQHSRQCSVAWSIYGCAPPVPPTSAHPRPCWRAA